MEAVDPHVEAAVLWLAQTILEVLFAGKMEAWIRLVGLADDTEMLKSEIERVEAVVTAVKGRAAENRPLARSLGRLKELLYDADDMVDELDYYRLQHQVEGGTIAWDNRTQGTDANGGAQLVGGSRDNPGAPNRNERKKRSKAWGEFNITEEDADGKPVKAECIHCGTQVRCETTKGTSVLHNHLKSENCKRKRAAIEQTPNPSSADDGAQNGVTVSTHDSDRRKRIRTDDVLAHNTADNTDLWDKAEICNRIQKTTHQLQKASSEIQKLYGSGYVATSNLCQNTVADPCRKTSSLVQRKMYGRVEEKDSIIKHMTLTGDKPDGVIVLPIVGSGGIGKTALAQLIYNDPIVKSQFDHRIWIWVSCNFDEVRLTTEMLDFVSQEKHAGISSLAKLQEILVSHVTSKRCLLILDDVWDNMGDHTWNKLLAPMQSDNENNVILVTTRKLSIANAIGTVEPIKLGALQHVDFLLLFRACAFGGDDHQGHPCLYTIGRQIEEKLYGNPLAADTVGMLLRVNLTVDHWSSILKNEKWKSLHLSNGIMYALKLSYDELPYYLQQCLLYCSIFPKNHRFLRNELVCIWISQGFVKCSRSMEKLEEIGRDYLTDLVNSFFFEIETKETTLGDQTFYVMPPLVHDFARLVSRTECAAIDGLECNGMLPSIRHLSVLTDSVYHEDQHGNILRNMKFEEKLRSITTTLRKLRTLVLIGKYDSFFFWSFLDAFHKAHYLRVLQISATYADLDIFLDRSESSTHLRHLKLVKGSGEALPIALSKFYHLQVLDVGHKTISNDITGLVGMRHLVVKKGAHVMNPNSFCFEMTQLESMNELLHLRVHQLQNVNVAEAYGAKLRDKQHLENMHLLWKYTLSQDDYDSDTRSEPYGDTEPEAATWPVNDPNNILTSEQQTYTEREVLEGLEPHPNLKHLRISGYSGTTFPDWLSSKFSVTCMQTLHLDNCGECEVIPSLEMLRFLTKLMLENMPKVTQVSIPSLEELVLIQMPNLEKCSCNSVRDLNSSLRVLVLEGCYSLKAFPLFESCDKFRIEQKSWLSGLSKLVIRDCPQLVVSNPLPPSSRSCELSISRVLTLPTMKGSSNGLLTIGAYKKQGAFHDNKDSDELTELDDKILAFLNLRALTILEIVGCGNLMSISLEGLRKLISLKTLIIWNCKDLFPSTALPEDSYEGMAPANFGALPSLKRLSIHCSGIAGRWLSLMLRHVQTLEEISLSECGQITGFLVEEEESELSNLSSAPEASLSGNPDETSSSRDGLLCIPSNLISSLKSICFEDCDELTFQGNKKGFSEFTSLEDLTIDNCPKMISSCVDNDKNDDHAFNGRLLLPQSLVELVVSDSPETLQLCFPGHLTCLKILELWGSPCLQSLQLHYCTALEELRIRDCRSLTEVEGLPSLGGIRSLDLRHWPGLVPWLERLLSEGYDMRPRLVHIGVDDRSILTTSFCMHLTSLRYLEFLWWLEEVSSLTDEQERALQLLTSLQEIKFYSCKDLEDLPVGLHSLPSLKRLEIDRCQHISKLPEKGLPPSLEELRISGCNEELTEQCRELATSKLKVKIDGKYVN